MSLLSRAASFWRNLTRRTRIDRDLDDELRGYVELLTQEKMKAGVPADLARRAALIEVGGVEQVKDEVREVRAGAVLDTVLQDIRYGVRVLAKSPGFTLAAVTALALGIGASTAMLSVVDAVLLRPLPYADPDRLTVILHEGDNPVAPANFLDWRRDTRAFERMGAAEYWTPNLTGSEVPEKLWALRLTSDILPLLGVRPQLGRVFLAHEDQPGNHRVVVIGYTLWQRLFAGDPGVVGREMVLNGEGYTIIGVMPREFAFAPFWATEAELWAPLPLGPRVGSRQGNSLRVFARLAPGVTLEQGRSEIATMTGNLEREFPGTNRNVTVTALEEKVVGDIKPALLVLLGAVGFVMLIACANVAHMLLARAAARHREIAVRTALGASRSRLVRQFLTESLLLSLTGGIVGTSLALVGIRALITLGSASIPRIEAITVDGRVLLATLLISLATGVIFGLAPTTEGGGGRQNLGESLREGERGSTEGAGRHRLRGILVASEFALALVLLVGAGLMIRTFTALRAVDPGFDPHHVLSMVVSVAGSKQADSARRAAFFQEALERLRATPGVTSAGVINHLPLAGDNWGTSFYVEGQPAPGPGDFPRATYRVVLPGYFRTMGIPMLQGRDVGEGDKWESPRVVVVNEQLARRYWPGESAIGKRVSFTGSTTNPRWVTVVGVSKTTKQIAWTETPDNEIYLSYLQDPNYSRGSGLPTASLTFVVRTAGDPAAIAPAARNAIWAIDRNLPVSELQTMDTVVEHATAEPRFYLVLLGAFAGVALALAAVGIYGVMSYAVSRRSHEIGIRMALGARQADVLRLVVGQGMALAIVGGAVGLLGAFALTRLMDKLLYGVGATDPITFGAVALVLFTVALLASYLPARRAARIDPIIALRSE